MEIPKTFQLGAHTWTVRHVDGMIKASDGDECRGLCDYDTLTISVNVRQLHSMVLHTYLHEKMHAMLWTIGSDRADDEGFVDALSGILAQGILTSS